jgi:hypothetical protein
MIAIAIIIAITTIITIAVILFNQELPNLPIACLFV